MSSRTLTASLAALVLSAGALAATATGVAFGDSGNSGDAPDLLRSSMAGSLTSDKPIFSTVPGGSVLVTPGGAPWDLAEGSARVRADGRTEVEVRGLLIPNVGVATVRTVTASLICNGAVVDTSMPVPLSTAGDATIEDDLMVPARCIAPVVMVNPNGRTGAFIAISGRQR